MMAKKTGKAYYMISAVAQKYNIHPQTLRLYEREGLLAPSRTEGNTRLYSEEDLDQLETILSLTRDLGVNLAGVEIILNMRRKMERMQSEVNEASTIGSSGLARRWSSRRQLISFARQRRRPLRLRKLRATDLGNKFRGGESENDLQSSLLRIFRNLLLVISPPCEGLRRSPLIRSPFSPICDRSPSFPDSRAKKSASSGIASSGLPTSMPWGRSLNQTSRLLSRTRPATENSACRFST
jgi:MerR family transcriptional regulator, heat shock protein HspR